MAALAYARVWKTRREEKETSPVWNGVEKAESSGVGAGQKAVFDRIFEIPYVLSLFVLPVSAISVQTFSLALIVFYVCDNFYNVQLAQEVGASNRWSGSLNRLRGWLARAVERLFSPLIDTAPGRFVLDVVGSILALVGTVVLSALAGIAIAVSQSSIQRVVLQRFFVRRARLDTVLLVVSCSLFFLSATATPVRVVSEGIPEWSGTDVQWGFVGVVVLLLMEVVVEPFRTKGLQYVAHEDEPSKVMVIPNEGEDDDEAVLRLWPVTNDLRFDELWVKERPQVERLVAESGHGGKLLLLVSEDAGQPVDFVFLEPSGNGRLKWRSGNTVARDKLGSLVNEFIREHGSGMELHAEGTLAARIVVWDVGFRPRDKSAWLARIKSELRDALRLDKDVVVFPELMGWGLRRYVTSERPVEAISDVWMHELLPELKGMLEGRDVLVALGSYPHQDAGTHWATNRATVWHGGKWHFFDKVHPTQPELVEDPPIRPGREIPVFDFKGGRASVVICFTVEMPEVATALKKEAVRLLLVPSDTVDDKGVQRVLRSASARAVELGAAVLVSPLVGSQDDWVSIGRAAFFLPAQNGFDAPVYIGNLEERGISHKDVTVPWTKLLKLGEEPETLEARPFADTMDEFTIVRW